MLFNIFICCFIHHLCTFWICFCWLNFLLLLFMLGNLWLVTRHCVSMFWGDKFCYFNFFLHSILRYSCYLDSVCPFNSCSQMSWVLDQNSLESGANWSRRWGNSLLRTWLGFLCVLSLSTEADGSKNFLHLYVRAGNYVAYCFPVLFCPVLISFLSCLCRSVLCYRIEGVPQQISGAFPITLYCSTLSHKL